MRMHRRARKQAPRSVAQWLLLFSHYPRSSLPGWPRRPSRGTGMRGVHPRRAHQFAPSPPEREQAEWRRLDRVRAGGYVRVQAVSLAWTEEVGGDRAVVSSAEGLAKCRRPGAGPQESWTIESARWHFLKRVCAHRPDLVDFVGAEVRHQQRLEAEGHRSFTWAVLKAAQALMGATAVQVVSLLVHAGPTCGWTARARFPICSHTRTLATTRSHARSHMRARTHTLHTNRASRRSRLCRALRPRDAAQPSSGAFPRQALASSSQTPSLPTTGTTCCRCWHSAQTGSCSPRGRRAAPGLRSSRSTRGCCEQAGTDGARESAAGGSALASRRGP